MATLTAYTPFAAYNPVFDASSFSFVYGPIVTFTDTHVRTISDNKAQDFFGSGFTRNTMGDITGGVVQQTKLWVDGVLQYTIDGLSLSAAEVASFDPAVNKEGGLIYYLMAGNDVFNGSPGNDVIEGGGGNDYLDGAAGLDTVAIGLGRDDYRITRTSSGLTLTKLVGPTETDTLVNIERLQFLDWGVAFDLGANQAAGNTVRVIGAAFDGRAIQDHPDWVTLGLQMFGSGMTLGQVCDWVAGQALRMSNEAFVDAVYANVVGAAPAQAERDQFLHMLQASGGSTTQGELLEFAATCDANLVNVDLVGLQQTGVTFW